MRVIYKFPTPTPGGSSIPYRVSHGVIIHVGLDGQNYPSFWVELDKDEDQFPVDFFVVGTGWEIPNREGFWALHTGTWIDGQFVWHMYRWIEDKYSNFQRKASV